MSEKIYYLICVAFLLNLEGCTFVRKAPDIIVETSKNTTETIVEVSKKTPGAMVDVSKKTPGAIIETGKVIWGSSTRALEKAREYAFSKDYSCPINECFQAVLSLAWNEPKLEPLYVGPLTHQSFHKEQTVSLLLMGSIPAEEASTSEATIEAPSQVATQEVKITIQEKKIFNIFIKNYKKQHIVVMGIPGQIETTEAGIFFSQIDEDHVKVEVTSLSEDAKGRVALAIFDELDYRFSSKD